MTHKPEKPADGARQTREARRRLETIGEEGGLSAAPKARPARQSIIGHLMARDAREGDSVERWGMRIGRWLSAIVFVLLVIWLIAFLGRGA